MKVSANRLRIAVLFGGRSAEHEVSLTSARAVIAALQAQPKRFEVLPIAITKRGRWFTGPNVQALLEATEGYRPLPSAIEQENPVCDNPAGEGLAVVRQGKTPELLPIDVVFPVLHGPGGEDGTVQGLFEVAGLPYVGCGVAASAAGMDKVLSKAMFASAQLPQLPYRWFYRRDWPKEASRLSDEIEWELGFPCFVKPANMGSSIGISKVAAVEQLPSAVALAGKHDHKIVVEQAAEDCREIECAVLGGNDPQASVLGEIRPNAEFYDYNAKYFDKGVELIVPADLPQKLGKRIQELSLRAFAALDCHGMARVDFFVGAEGKQVWLNELNTIPGFTPVSMYPKLWEASGLPFGALVTRLIELALERAGDSPET